jgi:putative nucleotidyltransferase with HDIG domain
MSNPRQPHIDAATERRLDESLERRSRRGIMPPRERVIETGVALAFLAGALGLAVLGGPAKPFSPPLTVAFVAAYIVVMRVEFLFGATRAVPTQLLFVPMLLLLPAALVPLITMAAYLVWILIEIAVGRRSRARLLTPLADAAFSLAPAVVLVLAGDPHAHWGAWPVFLGAIAAQYAVDGAIALARERLISGTHPRELVGELLRIVEIDALLTPIGLLAAVGAADAPFAALLVLPLVLLLAVFAREREVRIAQTIELSRSYRGTALLLRDLLEEDDEYTGHHTEDVVDLSVRVAEQLGVTEDVKRETELGALLHDIGKIHIPDAIINKPGKLDDAEWAIMKTHTIEGQKMLDQVGGLLSSVGLVVRASHERYDGAGYPDGLAGDAIPLAARIVAVCDSFNAMTTTRSYRRAMPVSDAVTELRRCSGTQFDPAVVAALLAVVGDPGWQLTVREAPVVAPVPVRA